MLKREINATSLLLLSAGGMIGSSWLFSPFLSVQLAGPWALLAWLIAAIFMLLIALPLCELSALFPMAGGMVNYPQLTHGRGIGFLFSWTVWLAYVVCAPIEVQAVLQYASPFFPKLLNAHAKTYQLSHFGMMVAVLMLFIITVINYFGVKLFNSCNKFISTFKFIVPSLAIIAFFTVAPSYSRHIEWRWPKYQDWHFIFSALSLGGIAFAFTGFQNAMFMAGEAKDPKKALPYAILGALVIGFVLYFLLQWSFIVAIPDTYLHDGWHHLSFQGDSAPLVGLGVILGLGWIASLLIIDASVSPLGTTLVYTAVTSRILYAMGMNRELPKIVSRLNRFRVPATALGVNFLIGILAFFPFSGWQTMVAFLSSCSIMSYLIGPICLMSLRIYRPDLRASFRLQMVKLFCFLGFYAGMLMLYWSGFQIIWKLSLAICLGILLYSVTDKTAFNYKRWYLWVFLFMSSLLMMTYFSPYGGSGVVLLPYDMILMLFISYILFRLSVWMAIPENMLVLPEQFQQLLAE